MSGKLLRSWAAAAVVAAIGFGTARPAEADAYDYDRYDYRHGDYEYDVHRRPRVTHRPVSHVDDVATRLQAATNELCLELYYNYRHNPGFREVYGEAYEILATTRYIHGLEHAGNERKLRQAIAELDGLFRHVRSEVEPWRVHRHRHIGRGGLMSKLDAVEEDLAHLMDDLGVRPEAMAAGPEESPLAGAERDGPPGPVPMPGTAPSPEMLPLPALP